MQQRHVTDPLDELFYRRPVRQHVREFGAIFATIGVGIAAYSWYSNGSQWTDNALISAALGLCFAVLGYFAPAVLRPVWSGWMAFGHALGQVMTTVILFLTWLALVIPMAILLKVIRRRVMDTTFRSPVQSYWETRDPKYDDFKLLERQF